MATANGVRASGGGLATPDIVEWLRARMDKGVVIHDAPGGLRWADRRIPSMMVEVDDEIERAVDWMVASGSHGWAPRGGGWFELVEVVAA